MHRKTILLRSALALAYSIVAFAVSYPLFDGFHSSSTGQAAYAVSVAKIALIVTLLDLLASSLCAGLTKPGRALKLGWLASALSAVFVGVGIVYLPDWLNDRGSQELFSSGLRDAAHLFADDDGALFIFVAPVGLGLASFLREILAQRLGHHRPSTPLS
jgi:hypothetical protein